VSDSAELARALRVLRQVFGDVTVIYDLTRGEGVYRDGPTIIDHRAIASGRRRSKNLTEYRDAQQATRRPA
jgi:hypothetical protein